MQPIMEYSYLTCGRPCAILTPSGRERSRPSYPSSSLLPFSHTGNAALYPPFANSRKADIIPHWPIDTTSASLTHTGASLKPPAKARTIASPFVPYSHQVLPHVARTL